MPMDPMDVMWMSKAPTVSDVVVSSTVVFKSAVGSSPQSPNDNGVRPDFDTDCLWKPHRLNSKNRTISTDSSESDVARKTSEVNVQESSSPVEVQGRTRRLSFTEMIFGSPSGGFSWGQASSQLQSIPDGDGDGGRKTSVTEDIRFKELMKHQNKVLGDDGVSSSFKKRDYLPK